MGDSWLSHCALDQLCFGLRRLAVSLNWIVGEDFPAEDLKGCEGLTYLEALEQNPGLQLEHPKGKIAPLSSADYGEENLWDAWNFAYAPRPENTKVEVPTQLVPPIGPLSNSIIFQMYQALRNENSENSDPVLHEGLDWFLENVRVPNQISTRLREQRDASE